MAVFLQDILLSQVRRVSNDDLFIAISVSIMVMLTFVVSM